MHEDELRSWLEAYGESWETHDEDRFVALFTETATYSENPFDAPRVGSDAIRAYFGLMAQHQQDVSFRFDVLATTPVLVRWWASYTKAVNGEPTRLDGIFLLEFDQHRCISLHEWWHADPSPAF